MTGDWKEPARRKAKQGSVEDGHGSLLSRSCNHCRSQAFRRHGQRGVPPILYARSETSSLVSEFDAGCQLTCGSDEMWSDSAGLECSYPVLHQPVPAMLLGNSLCGMHVQELLVFHQVALLCCHQPVQGCGFGAPLRSCYARKWHFQSVPGSVCLQEGAVSDWCQLVSAKFKPREGNQNEEHA